MHMKNTSWQSWKRTTETNNLSIYIDREVFGGWNEAAVSKWLKFKKENSAYDICVKVLQAIVECLKCLELTAHGEYIVVLTLIFWAWICTTKTATPGRNPVYATGKGDRLQPIGNPPSGRKSPQTKVPPHIRASKLTSSGVSTTIFTIPTPIHNADQLIINA